MNNDNTLQGSDNCCGGPAPENTQSCCIADTDAKSAGKDGCGCTTETPMSNPVIVKSTCCG